MWNFRLIIEQGETVILNGLNFKAEGSSHEKFSGRELILILVLNLEWEESVWHRCCCIWNGACHITWYFFFYIFMLFIYLFFIWGMNQLVIFFSFWIFGYDLVGKSIWNLSSVLIWRYICFLEVIFSNFEWKFFWGSMLMYQDVIDYH